MKKKITTLLLFTTLIISSLIGCTKSEKNKNEEENKYVISNKYVDVVNYKNLIAEKKEINITETEVDTYIEYIMNITYNTQDNKNQKDYTIKDLTDQMVKEMSGNDYTDIASYRAFIREVIEKNSLDYNISTTKETLFQQIAKDSVLKEYEEEKLQTYIDYLNDYYTVYAEYLGHDFETFYKDVLRLSTKEAYDTYVKEESINNLKNEYIIHAIAEAEKIIITDADIDAQINEYIKNNNFNTAEDVLKNITRDEIKTNLENEKILEIIYNNANFSN